MRQDHRFLRQFHRLLIGQTDHLALELGLEKVREHEQPASGAERRPTRIAKESGSVQAISGHLPILHCDTGMATWAGNDAQVPALEFESGEGPLQAAFQIPHIDRFRVPTGSQNHALVRCHGQSTDVVDNQELEVRSCGLAGLEAIQGEDADDRSPVPDAFGNGNPKALAVGLKTAGMVQRAGDPEGVAGVMSQVSHPVD